MKKTKVYKKTYWSKQPKERRKKKKIVNRSTLDKKILILWSKIVRARTTLKCEVNDFKCSGNSEAHHFISRANRRLRYDLHNGVKLCSYHHKWGIDSFHNNPIKAINWMEENRDEDLTFIENAVSLGTVKWSYDELLAIYNDLLEVYENIDKNS